MQDILSGTAAVLLYIAVCVPAAFVLRLVFKLQAEPFRKLLHAIAFCFVVVCAYGFARWQSAVLFCLIFPLPIYPILAFLERYPLFRRLTNQRRTGEVKHSLLSLFFTIAAVLAVCWGWLDDRMLAVASIFAWGFGDGVAALVGKKYGKHKIPGSAKSWEGSGAMFLVSLICTTATLAVRGGLPLWACPIAAAPTAAAAAYTEFKTPGGHDTITCPLTAMAVLIPTVTLLEGLL